MSDKATGATDWRDLADQSWEAWLGFMERSGRSPDASLDSQAAIERVLGGLRDYFVWMQQAQTPHSGAAGPGAEKEADWQGPFRQFMAQASEPLRKAFERLDLPGAQAFEQQARQWFDAAQQPLSGLRDWLRMPNFGYAREYQQLQQRLLAAADEYQTQLKRYQAMMAQANLQGLALLEQRLAGLDVPPDSLRALYDLWVDAAEEAYAEAATSEAFGAVYGDLINAQSTLRELQQRQVNIMGTQWGWPTREEVDDIGKRLQAMRRELRAAHEEIAALKRTLASLKPQTAKRPARKTAAKKAPAAKSSPSTARRSSKATPRDRAGKS